MVSTAEDSEESVIESTNETKSHAFKISFDWLMRMILCQKKEKIVCHFASVCSDLHAFVVNLVCLCSHFKSL